MSYLVDQDFHLYIQWLNPGFHDPEQMEDDLNLVNEILLESSTFAIRDGKADPANRVREIREFIYGWAKYRNLIVPCSASQ